MHHAKPVSGRRKRLGYRCILLVPGDQPELFAPALASGADAVCFDLEATVASDHKLIGRTHVSQLLAELPPGSCDTIVRLNEPESVDWRGDVGAISKTRPDYLMVPKVTSEDGVRWVAEVFGGTVGLIPSIETAEGLDKVTWVGAASPAVGALHFGGSNLALELGAEPIWDALHYPRSRVVHAAALNGITAIDMASRNIDDRDGLWAEADRARRMGFVGKMAVHISQVQVIQEVFTPTPKEIEWAQGVMGVTRSGQIASVTFEGQMIDRPTVEAARRVLSRAETLAELETQGV